MTTPVVLAASSGYVFELAVASALGREITGVVGDGDSAARAAQLDVAHLGAQNDFRAVPRGAELGLIAATPVHPEAAVGPFVETGTIVSPGARMTANASIGRHVLVHTGAVVSHHDVLGDFVTLSPSATLCGGVSGAGVPARPVGRPQQP